MGWKLIGSRTFSSCPPKEPKFKWLHDKIYILKRNYLVWSTLRHHNKMVRKGYLSPEGEPIKCTHCGSTNIEDYLHQWGDGNGILEEFSVRCKDCKQHLGTNSYGGWDTY